MLNGLIKKTLQLGYNVIGAGMLFAFCSISPVYANPASPAYRVTKTVALGGGERWDFVVYDPSGKRVYVAHGDHVTVVNEPTGEVVGQIGPFPGGTHGIAVSTKTNQGYTDTARPGPRLHLI